MGFHQNNEGCGDFTQVMGNQTLYIENTLESAVLMAQH